MRKICFITGTRAEYGLLSRLMRMIKEDRDSELQIIATNMHLQPEYGYTYKEIEADGFEIDCKVPMPKQSDDALGTVKSMGEELKGLADSFEKLQPDLIVILGDRYEMLMAASAALMFRIPVAHIHGGEITEGAFDDAIRHSITKMSHLHFASTEEYRQRIVQLGENPDRVFYVGAIGVDNIKKVQLMTKDEVEVSLGFAIDKNTVLATYHPVTLANSNVEDDVDAFLSAISEFPDLKVIFTMPNSDTGGNLIAEKINRFVAQNSERTIAFKSLGMKRYLSVIPHVAAVIGNSSSGIVEVPSFGIPTLNIGDRQKGRVSCESVVDCMSDKDSIVEGLKRVLSSKMASLAKCAKNPYDKIDTVKNIFEIIRDYPLDGLVLKKFYDIR